MLDNEITPTWCYCEQPNVQILQLLPNLLDRLNSGQRQKEPEIAFVVIKAPRIPGTMIFNRKVLCLIPGVPHSHM